jgi:diguanylate cyclase (GGDEF)-like protein/PAS domain S-box-containing protein
MPNRSDLLQVTLQFMRDAVVTTDANGRVQSLNPAAEALTGWTESDAIGKPIEEVVDLREQGSESPLPSPAYAALNSAVRVDFEGQALLIARGGLRTAVQVSAAPIVENQAIDRVEAQAPLAGSVLIFYDLTEALQLADRRFYLAHHDPLTGLPNRILLVDRMEQATKFADRHSDQMAVLSMDIDHFRQINETYGQIHADSLLKEAASRIAEALRESDTVSRLGADDFIILLPGVTSRADVENLAAKLVRAMAQPFAIGDVSIEATCSIGISLYPQHAVDAGTLMRLADAAMLQAKRDGRNRYLFAR